MNMNKKVLVFGIGLILTCTFAFAQEIEKAQSFPENLTGDHLYEEGVKLYKLEKYQESISYLEEACKRKTCFCEAYYQLGLCYFKIGKLSEAKESLGRVRIISSDNDLRDKALIPLNQIFLREKKLKLYEKGLTAFKSGAYQQAYKYFSESSRGDQGIIEEYILSEEECKKIAEIFHDDKLNEQSVVLNNKSDSLVSRQLVLLKAAKENESSQQEVKNKFQSGNFDTEQYPIYLKMSLCISELANFIDTRPFPSPANVDYQKSLTSKFSEYVKQCEEEDRKFLEQQIPNKLRSFLKDSNKVLQEQIAFIGSLQRHERIINNRQNIIFEGYIFIPEEIFNTLTDKRFFMPTEKKNFYVFANNKFNDYINVEKKRMLLLFEMIYSKIDTNMTILINETEIIANFIENQLYITENYVAKIINLQNRAKELFEGMNRLAESEFYSAASVKYRSEKDNFRIMLLQDLQWMSSKSISLLKKEDVSKTLKEEQEWVKRTKQLLNQVKRRGSINKEVTEKQQVSEIIGKDDASMMLIPAGEFLMGSPVGEGNSNERPQHTVYLDAYYIDKYPVTVAQYRKFCQATGRRMPKAPRWGWRNDHPVVNVSWEDAAAYAKYYGKRLPTEAEWEKACRGGTETKYFFGDDESQLGDYAWYKANSGDTTLPVGKKKPNAWGLYDMYGNVWEWCADWYDVNYYGNSPKCNPQGPASGSRKIMRGGAHIHESSILSSAYRGKRDPKESFQVDGFRCVMSAY
jgi:formylglycine-generating enzyme